MTDPGTPAERAEAAATRRRWITLAEVVAVAGVLIAALTLWNSWSERRDAAAEKAAAEASATRQASRIDLTAVAEGDGDRLRLRDERHDITDVAIRFPKALGVGEKRPVEPLIDAGWFRAELLRATDGGADDQTGRLPVLVSVRYWAGDTKRSASGIYDVIWRTKGRRVFGRSLKVEALRLRERSGDAAALDRMWSGASAG